MLEPAPHGDGAGGAGALVRRAVLARQRRPGATSAGDLAWLNERCSRPWRSPARSTWSSRSASWRAASSVFTKLDMRVLGTYVVRFALPALVFTALSQRPVSEILNGRYILDYAVGSLVVMLVAFAWGWWRQGKSFTLSALCGLGMSSSNSGFIGYPIAVQVVGPATAAVGAGDVHAGREPADDSADAGDGRQRPARAPASGIASCCAVAGQLARNPVILAMRRRLRRVAARRADHAACWRARSTCWRCRRRRCRCSSSAARWSACR